MNIVTIVFCADLANLFLQAHTLKKNWKGLKEWIIIAEDNETTVTWCEENIRPIMSDWNLIIQTGQTIRSEQSWHRQQIYKLLTVRDVSTQEYSLILDAKNFMIRQTFTTDFLVDGKINVQVKYNDPDEQWIKTCNYCGKDPEKIVRGYQTTPWVWRKDLIEYVCEWYKDQNLQLEQVEELPVYEFETVWALTQDSIPWQEKKLSEGVYAYPDTVEEINRKIIWAKKFDVPFWVFHRYHWNNQELCAISNKFLKDRLAVDDDMIEQWKILSLQQARQYPNKMMIC